ncbi:MAG TPA: hypothetical protein PKM27_04375 [Saprospiraceae bacterium]|nr:hypothetical protein [Saprospiraceae bacterium]HNT21106.1 hypothetical protein [Saprospiraceae bacterium]
MAETPFNPAPAKPKSFWKRPEGVTGTIVLLGLLAGGGFLLYKALPTLIALASNMLTLVLMLLALGAIIYMVLDPKMRALVGYAYKSIMRWVTGLFITIDPIGILKNYVEDLEDNLSKMSTQIGNLKGQIRKLTTMVEENTKEIQQNMVIASKAKELGQENQMILASRKAARLKEVNVKYDELRGKMDILYRVLTKMYQNSEVLLEDTRDQVKIKEEERKAIRASHGAMRSAMAVLSGDKDKRAMFDLALENIADDVAAKVGEMERFMELSSNFMNSVDLQNGVFEEEGARMLEQWEKESHLLLMSGKEKANNDYLNLGEPQKATRSSGGYEGMFDAK